MIMARKKDTKQRFEAKFIKLSVDECWEWTAGLIDGYGQFKNRDGGERLAHRRSYTLYVGPIPNGMLVCHTCDNKICVNPKHLFLGTVQDNITDMVLKDRNARGERNFKAKLTDENVNEIRSLYLRDSYHSSNAKELSKKFNVSVITIQRIVRNSSWKHLLGSELQCKK